MTDFKGHFSELFPTNGQTAAGDADRARQPPPRGRDRGRAAQGGGAQGAGAPRRRRAPGRRSTTTATCSSRAGTGRPAATTRPWARPPTRCRVAVSPAVNRSRETPAPGGGSGGGGRHLVGPPLAAAHLRDRARRARTTASRPRPAALRADYASFQARVPLGHAERVGRVHRLRRSGSRPTTTTSTLGDHRRRRLQGRPAARARSRPSPTAPRRRPCRPPTSRSTRQDLVIDPRPGAGPPADHRLRERPGQHRDGQLRRDRDRPRLPRRGVAAGAVAHLQLLPHRRGPGRAGRRLRPRLVVGLRGRAGPRRRAGPARPARRPPDLLPAPRRGLGPRRRREPLARPATSPRASSWSPATTARGRASAPGVRCSRTGPVRSRRRPHVEVSRDAEGRVVRLTHARGQWVELERAATRPAASASWRRAPPTAARVTYAYDDEGRLVSATGAARHPDLPLGRRTASSPPWSTRTASSRSRTPTTRRAGSRASGRPSAGRRASSTCRAA